MATPLELAEQLISLLTEQGLIAKLGHPIQSGHRIDLQHGPLAGLLSVYVRKNGVATKVLQPPAFEQQPEISSRVNAAWEALTGQLAVAPQVERPVPQPQQQPQSRHSEARPAPLLVYLEKLHDVADACATVEAPVDWDPLAAELGWIASQAGVDAAPPAITSLDDWRRAANGVVASLAAKNR